MSKKLLHTTAAHLMLSTNIRVIVFSLLFIALLGSFGYSAAGQQRRPAVNNLVQQSSNDAASVIFRNGRDLITDGQWAKAQETFERYVNTYPNEKNIDVALYWKAYAEQKLAKVELCRATLNRLLENYPNSTWRNDARLLLAQVAGAPQEAYVGAYRDSLGAYRNLETARPPVAPRGLQIPRAIEVTPRPAPDLVLPTPTLIAPMPAQSFVWDDAIVSRNSDDSDDPCEFKIVVLQALFQTDVQRGIVAATEWLKPGSNQTIRCKSAALSLLGRHGGKSVTPVILGFAKSEPDVKLRARAISALAETNDDTVVDSLRDFAMNSPENEIVEAALYALSRHTGDRAIAVLTDIALSGKVLSQRKMAISSISTRAGEPAVDALLRIYDAEASPEIRKTVISGFGNRKSERAGNKLFEIARSSENVELRKAAVTAISRRGGDKAVDFLLSLYDTEKNEEVKDQILSALSRGGIWNVYAPGQRVAPTVARDRDWGTRAEDPRVIKKLIQIARDPQAPMQRRKQAIGMLSQSKDPEVLKFLEELLK